MGVGQKPLGHTHGEERDAALLDQCADRIIGLRIGGALAENNQRTLCAFQHIERALDRGGIRKLGRRRVDHLDQ